MQTPSPSIVVTPPSNADENATTLAPTDQSALEEAKRTHDPSRLTTLEQKAAYQQWLVASANTTGQQTLGGIQFGATSATGSTAQSLTPGSLTPDQKALLAQNAYNGGVATNSPAPGTDVWKQSDFVLRAHGKPGYGVLAPGNRSGTNRYATIDEFTGEYPSKVENDAFREWLTRRGVLLYGMDPNDPEFLTKGLQLWNLAGAMVASDPRKRVSQTPEEWLDQQYAKAGGDAAFDAKVAATAPANPITTNRATYTVTIDAAQAQSFLDDISRSLLGRMASDTELKKARASMQRLLTPTVVTTRSDATDPANIVTTSHTNQGVSAEDAANILEMRMRRGSEGMAFNVGKMFEAALQKMA